MENFDVNEVCSFCGHYLYTMSCPHSPKLVHQYNKAKFDLEIKEAKP